MDMTRRMQRGQVYRKGSIWLARWWEDVRTIDGQLQRARFARKIAEARGPEKKTEAEAYRLAWGEIFCRLDAAATRPASLATVAEFWAARFNPEWVAMLKPSGRKHYRYLERALLEWCPSCHGRQWWKAAGARGWQCAACRPAPAGQAAEHSTTASEFAETPLRSVTPSDLNRIVQAGLARGISTQTAAHWRNGLSALFTHARAVAAYAGENPAASVRLPAIEHKETRALTFDQARALFELLPLRERAAAVLSCCTSMNIAELAGLRVSRVNLSDQATVCDGDLLPAASVAVREHYYRGAIGTLKTGRRRRIIPLSQFALETLRAWQAESKHKTPEAFVFAGRNGRPLSEGNSRARVLKPAARALGLDWVSWHTFRRSTATWAEAVQMQLSDRMAILGHGSAEMTMLYTAADMNRRRESLNEIGEHLRQKAPPPVQ
jgi:integrase